MHADERSYAPNCGNTHTHARTHRRRAVTIALVILLAGTTSCVKSHSHPSTGYHYFHAVRHLLQQLPQQLPPKLAASRSNHPYSTAINSNTAATIAGAVCLLFVHHVGDVQSIGKLKQAMHPQPCEVQITVRHTAPRAKGWRRLKVTPEVRVNPHFHTCRWNYVCWADIPEGHCMCKHKQ